MKLLFYIASMQGGGAERVMSLLTGSLVRRGHQVWLATDCSAGFAYSLDERVKLIDIDVTERRRFVLPLLIKKMRRAAQTVRPDVAISFIWLTSGRVRLALMGLGIPLIASEHTTFDMDIHTTWQKIKRILSIRFADQVTVLTKADAEHLKKKKIARNTVMTNPCTYPIHGHDTEPRQKSVLAVGSVGRWYNKGFGRLIEIWGELAPRYPEWTLEIAGTGGQADFESLRGIAAKSGVAERVKFLGFVSDIDELMRRSEVFAFTSRFEGFGMTLLEAMSQGCACVSYDCPNGPRDIITNEVSGLLVKNQDKEAFRDALSRVMEDAELRERLSWGGRKEAERFALDVIVDRWEKLFGEL